MDLRARYKIRGRLNKNEWIIPASKRKKDTVNKSKESSKTKIRKNSQFDKFCWVCHNPKGSGGKDCSKCPRTYHVKCLKNQIFDAQNSCPECQLTSLIGENSVSSCERIKELLMYAVDRTFSEIKKIKDIFFKWPENEANSKLHKIVDKEYFCQKLIEDSYRTHLKFWSDFKWIYHNSVIVYGEKSENARDAEELSKKMHEELSRLEACTDCYFYRNSKTLDEATFFSYVCSKPHEVIMAKVKGFTYWPAKCLQVTKKGSAVVVFFGTHDIANVPANMWFPLKIQPEFSQQQKQYCTAMNELLNYNVNLKEQLGSQKIVRAPSGVEKVDKETQVFQSDITESASSIFHNDSVMEISDDCAEYKPNINGMLRNYPENNNTLFPRISSYESTSVSMTFFQEDTTDSNKNDISQLLDIHNTAPVNKSEFSDAQPLHNDCSFSNRNLSIDGQFSTKSPNNFKPAQGISSRQLLSTETKPTDDDFQIIQIDNLKEKGHPVVNLDTGALAGLIASRDPHFAAFFQEKSKELFDSMMIHEWAKLQMLNTPSNLPSYLEENSSVRKQSTEQPQRLGDSQRELKCRLSNSDDLVRKLKDTFETQMKRVIQERDDMLSEMRKKLDAMKTEIIE